MNLCRRVENEEWDRDMEKALLDLAQKHFEYLTGHRIPKQEMHARKGFWDDMWTTRFWFDDYEFEFKSNLSSILPNEELYIFRKHGWFKKHRVWSKYGITEVLKKDCNV